jgi:hypothetical protein
MKLAMKQRILTGVMLLAMSATGFAAYHHMGEMDSANFVAVYPDKAGTKLDSCALCHTGGTKGSTVLGSCQWCHDSTVYGYDKSGDITKTLNSYGAAYLARGRNVQAVRDIAGQDSDLDGWSNADEIAALRFPGDKTDDPGKVAAPYMVFTREQLECLPQHTQFQLLNATKSDDSYAEFSGVGVEDLLKAAKILPAATSIQVYSPDGFMNGFSLYPDPKLYHVIGDYPQGSYHYAAEADMAINPTTGWCRYSEFGDHLNDGDSIENEDGLKLLLAMFRDREKLVLGVLGKDNKLNGEGPYRVVPPEKVPGPPDQRSTSVNQNVIWPYDANGDHNAGFSPRSATIIKVVPLPGGTTDIDLLEAGWKYIDESKIVVYGAIHPGPTILSKLDALIALMESSDRKAYKNVLYKKLLVFEAQIARQFAKCGKYKAALSILEKGILTHADGCSAGSGGVDRNDWVKDCELQKKIYWSLNELIVLFGIIV